MPLRYCYYVYIVTNSQRTVFYTGVTNDIVQRLIEHWSNRGQPRTFTGKYYCYNLVYLESYRYINKAIQREKEIKGWSRQKKLDLVRTQNPGMIFLNLQVCEEWPPINISKRL